jgi:hypothetical protein
MEVEELMALLTDMILNSEEYTQLQKPAQLITLTLGKKFEESTEYLFLSPEEIVDLTHIGTVEQWNTFFNLQTVKTYIQSQMAAIAQISQRKTFRSLVEMALSGGQGASTAAKQIQELSGIMNQIDSNKIVVLHHIPRATKTNKEAQDGTD